MALIDSLKWDATPDVFAWKYPENNLTTFTQLVVNETQEALLIHKGKLVATFGAGKHTLSTENIPLLENLFGIPFGGNNPFTAEVWFINKVFSLDNKWGTPQPISLRDPHYSVVVPVRAYGQFGVNIEDSEKFLLSLVGTLPQFDKKYLAEYFRGLILSCVTSVVSKTILDEKICVLDIVAQLSLLSDRIAAYTREKFAQFGINISNFYINQISIDQDDLSVKQLKELMVKKAEMEVLGYTYQQQRSFDVLENAAQNEGSSGGIMGAGMGLGMGLNLGGTMGNMMGSMVQPQVATQSPAPTQPQMTPMPPMGGGEGRFCGKCGGQIEADDKFCTQCGVMVKKACPQCAAVAESGDKFCAGCGTSL